MIQITDKSKCCGCTACANICPENCITMKPDFEGFLYPEVNKEGCVNCGACDEVCPVREHVKPESEYMMVSYVVRNRQKEVFMNSPSGGFFSAIQQYVIGKGGAVFGAGFEDRLKVAHSCVQHQQVQSKFMGSKYVQSDLGNTFKEVKKYLMENKIVLFSGTPCQIEGLKKYLSGHYENLITVDVICHGVPSPELWERYIEYQEQKNNSKICSVNFRKKTYGYHCGSMELIFENGTIYHGSARTDFMLKSFFKEISSRPSCYSCAFKTKEHCADFSLYDCWHADELVQDLHDDDCGYTNVLIHSDAGYEVFKNLSNMLTTYEADTEKAIKLDGPMIEHSAVPHKNRSIYYQVLNSQGLSSCVDKLIPISTKDKIIEKSKLLLYRTGIIKYAKQLKKIVK